MKQSGVAAITAMFLALCFALSDQAADLRPKLRLAEVQKVAPLRYRVDLTLDPEKPQFTGTIDIALDIKEALQTLWLNAADISVAEASWSASGKAWPAKISRGGSDFPSLQFEEMIPAGRANLGIRYSGTVRQKDSSGVFRADDLGNHYVLAQFESTYARNAFPCFDEPSYKVPWQLTLRVPAEDKALSNTPVASESTAGGTRTYAFQETKPLPSY